MIHIRRRVRETAYLVCPSQGAAIMGWTKINKCFNAFVWTIAILYSIYTMHVIITANNVR